MQHHIAIGSHHKTGTHWMRNVFRQFAKSVRAPFIDLSYTDKLDATEKFHRHEAARKRVVVFHEHSQFPAFVHDPSGAGFRGVRIVRDPRDVLVSAVNYHRKTDAGWVLKPQKRHGGVSLQSKLAALPDDEARYLYEIENVIEPTLQRMRDFDHGEVFADVAYEDLVTDRDLTLTDRMFGWLGLEPADAEPAARAMWDNSLFGALRPEGNDHISHGGAKQFEDRMSEAVLDRFRSRYADVIEVLGYAGTSNPRVLDRLAPKAPGLVTSDVKQALAG